MANNNGTVMLNFGTVAARKASAVLTVPGQVCAKDTDGEVSV